jgi:hypothetical protein
MKKTCKTCDIEKIVSEFYSHASYKDRLHHSCKSCVLAYNREKYKTSPLYREKRKQRALSKTCDQKQRDLNRSRDFYKSHRGRALTLIKSAERNAKRKKLAVDIDFDFVHQKLIAGVCEVTGLPFDFKKPSLTKKNSYAPSLDRINPAIGYVKDNVRVVIWQFNMMKGEISDVELLNLCNLIREKLTNGLHL